MPILGLSALGQGSIGDGLYTVANSHTEKLNAIGSEFDPTPFATLFTGMIFANLFYWCTNQYVIQRTLAATTYFGAEPFLTRGSTNSNIPISKGIPSVTIGRGGNGGKAHSLGEWWINEEGYKAIQLALLIVLSETGIN